MKTIATLSYFHRKIGPIVFYSYPENLLDDQLSLRIANIMDQTVSEGFFIHSFENRKSMNLYFEIRSDWARGNKDMLMISIIFDRQISPDLEANVKTLCLEFSDKLLTNENIFAAFYINDINNFDERDKELILNNNSLIKSWVKELYWAVIEETRERSEEEKIANLLNKRPIFSTLRKLSKGPITLEGLREWFDEEFASLDFKDLIETLVDKQFIFINQIGIVEKYVLLLKEVSAERIPPDSVIEYIEETPDQVERELIDLLLPKVQDYFSNYENKSKEDLEKDSYILFQIVSDPKKYNVLSELRNGLISKDNLPKLVSKRTLEYLNSSLKFLKKHDIIEELRFKGKRYVLLKTNIQITTSFPEYLRKLLPKEGEKT
ncbi:MAG: hypothetical protein P8Y23_11655 [Candidatus Lokiarchaeota archaeon]